MSDTILARSLDDFHEDILSHILTFLSTVYAVQTSILSRKWRTQKLWRSLPILNFDYSDFQHDPGWTWTLYQPYEECTRFPDFIDQTLERRSHIPILKFSLHLNSIDNISHSNIDKWISFAISHKVKDLNINFFQSCPYRFDFSLLKNSHVRDLSLTNGHLHRVNFNFNFDSIRSVCLKYITLTDDMVVDLISCCNNLESLVIKCCGGMRIVRICSSRLKKLSLDFCEGSSLEICCPNLGYILISEMKMEKFCIKDSSSVIEANLRFSLWRENRSDVLKWWSDVLRLLTSVKKLTTQNYFFELLCKKDDSLDGCVFENLNHLELEMEVEMGCRDCDLLGIAAFLKICPNITTLTLDFSWYNNEHGLVDKPIDFNIPNLRILNLINMEGLEIEKFVELMKKHGAALEKIVLWDWYGKRSSIILQGSS